jgi:DNA-binding response OmpR family regulator
MSQAVGRILVIEDDASIRLGLEDTLRAKGYAVWSASRGEDGLKLAAQVAPDLVILDIMLPDREGFEVCKNLRAPRSPAPDARIIMLTARGQELDRVRGFDVGADDYVTKPFSLMELLARVAAVLRRGPMSQGSSDEPKWLHFGDVHIDFVRLVAHKGGRPIELPARAFDVLRVFARHPGEVVSRDTLLNEAWGFDKGTNLRTVDNHIVKLRQALEDHEGEPRHIVTVHGAGYRLVLAP